MTSGSGATRSCASRDVNDYSFVDWLYGPTALTPEQEPPMFSAG